LVLCSVNTSCLGFSGLNSIYSVQIVFQSLPQFTLHAVAMFGGHCEGFIFLFTMSQGVLSLAWFQDVEKYLMCCLKFFFLNHSKCCLCHTRWASTGNSVFYYRCYVFIFIHWCILPLEIYSAVCSRGRAPALQVQSPEFKNQSPTTKINK
jgi:hypothetical protein